MSKNSKLYVFDKMEVVVLFTFIILVSITSFVFGIKIGKNYSYSRTDLDSGDRAKVEFLSGQEEQVEKVVDASKADPKKQRDVNLKSTYDKLKEEFDTLDGDKKKNLKEEIEVTMPTLKEDLKIEAASDIIDERIAIPPPPSNNVSDKFSGKYTIQLGSHRSVKQAEEFANGFKVRGYNPIINEVEIENKGKWYRTSLGVFGTISDAKDYILKEKTLFQVQEYVIGRFD
jgi:hypothetical protein